MAASDTPAYVRQAFDAQQLLVEVAGGTIAATVTLPANTAALWIFLPGGGPDPPLTVVGTTSGVSYPVYGFAGDNSNANAESYIAAVSPQVDPNVTITWSVAPVGPWYVVADAGPRLILDLATAAGVGQAGALTPGLAVQVAGSDGTDLRVLLTDATGRLITAPGSFPSVYAAPGAAIPADALMVGGSDGVDLRAVLLDAAGHVLTIDQTLKLAVAARGAAIPADAVQVAGTDGTDLRVLLTDSLGVQQTNDINVAAATVSPGNPAPGVALLIGGSDGVDLRALLTDNTGKLETVDQTLKLAAGVVGAATPADAVQIAGRSGGNLTVLATTPLGYLNTADALLDIVVAGRGTAVPADALLVGGSDGVDLRALLTDKEGRQYTVPSAPSTGAGDHPPYELLYANLTAATDFTVVVAAPGAGKRIRLFFAHVQSLFPAAGAIATYLYDTLATQHWAVAFANASASVAGQFNGGPSGVPITTNSGLNVTNNASAIGYHVGVVYTIETV